MTRFNLLATVAALALLGGATTAGAASLNAGGSGNVGVGVSTSTPAGDAKVGGSTHAAAATQAHDGTGGTTGAGASTHTYGEVVASIASGKGDKLPAHVSDATEVQVVAMTSLKGSAASHAKALAELASKHADAIASLDAKIKADAHLMASLTAAGYDATDVVAVTTSASGAVTLYVKG